VALAALILQNLHRYLLYFALLVLLFLWYDVWRALWPGGAFGLLGDDTRRFAGG
jgi:hypothetical protein